MIEHIVGKRSLGLFTLLFLIAIPAVSYALCEATLKWDPSSSNAEGYYVFGREEGQDYDYDEPWWQGDKTFTECTIEELDEDKTYFFVVRAYAGEAMSDDSNEVRFSYNDASNNDNPDIDNVSDSLSDGGTNSTSVGYPDTSGGCFISSLF